VEKYLEANRTQIWHMCIACSMPKATNTHSEYVILLFHCINGLHERASMLCYICIVWLVLMTDQKYILTL